MSPSLSLYSSALCCNVLVHLPASVYLQKLFMPTMFYSACYHAFPRHCFLVPTSSALGTLQAQRLNGVIPLWWPRFIFWSKLRLPLCTLFPAYPKYPLIHLCQYILPVLVVVLHLGPPVLHCNNSRVHRKKSQTVILSHISWLTNKEET